MDENADINTDQVVNFVGLTSEIVSAYVSNNPVRPADLPELLGSVHAALSGLNQGSAADAAPVEKPTPAQIRKSITPDALISFIDGKPYKMLKRHLTGKGMTIEQYRQRFGLPQDYPSTSANHSAMRAEFARSSGLGQLRRKAAPKASEPAETISEKPKRAGRPRKANVSAEA